MNIIIFSKNRAAQLDLLLRSIKKYFNFGTINILYAYSDYEYHEGYQLIKERYNVNLIWQQPFKKVLIDTIKDGDRFITMLVDDSVFINKVSYNEFLPMANTIRGSKLVKCGSLMLSKDIVYSYSHDHTMKPQQEIWDWTEQPMKTDWGYPHQIGGNIWTKEYLLKILRWKRFTLPTSLETKLSWPYRKRKTSTPLMTCFNETKLINIQINTIEREHTNNRTSGQYTLKELNDKYLQGYQISTKNIYGVSTDSISKDIDIKFDVRDEIKQL